jgi:hypothetical protein
MIKPTPGRVVWFTPPKIIGSTPFVHHDPAAPLAAMVCHVWNDRMVNLVVFDSNGASFGFTSVQLLQDDDAKPEVGYFCSWMPYQTGQAAKHAAEAAKV